VGEEVSLGRVDLAVEQYCLGGQPEEFGKAAVEVERLSSTTREMSTRVGPFGNSCCMYFKAGSSRASSASAWKSAGRTGAHSTTVGLQTEEGDRAVRRWPGMRL